ncbi:MAG: hypothetical protein QOI54_1891 [Actinomycetota bacterium]|jgi:glycosyltransferase involved in cell wall biosynthesis|nr:hypothetical protein [Actinomycetota bacterium]
MKIAMVSEQVNPRAIAGGTDGGGRGRCVTGLARALARAGHDVVVHTRREDPQAPHRTPLCDGLTVEQVPAGPPRPIPRDTLLRHAGAFGGSLAESWSQERPDVVHAHAWMSGLAAMVGARGLDLPVVQTFHALGTVERRHQGRADTSPPERSRLEAAIGRSVRCVIATCHDEAEELVHMGVPRRRISVVPVGVDVDHLAEEGPTLARSSSKRLVTIGRLVRHRGIETIIEALPRLPDVELLVAGGSTGEDLGEDPDVRRLRRCAFDRGVSDRVQLLGWVPHSDVPRLLRSADVFVTMPWYEPSGTTALEAMACGRPVVAAAVGGLLDTVLDGASGLLVPPRRPDLLVSALRMLLGDTLRREEMGMFAGVHARARYSWPRIAAETLQCYTSVLTEQPRAMASMSPPR